MRNTKLQLKKIASSKTIKEMFSNVTWDMIDKLAFLSIIFIVLSPISQILMNVYSYIIYGIEHDYYYTISSAESFTCVIGLLTIILYTGKNIVQKYRFSDFAKENNTIIFFALFTLLMIVSTCINGFTDYAIYGGETRHESIFTYMYYFIIYYFCASIINSKNLKAFLSYSFIFGSLLMGILVIIHVYISPIPMFVHFENQTMLTSIFTNSNHYGYYLVISIVLSSSLFVLEENKLLKAICMLNFIINNIILIINNTLGAYIACFMGLVFNIIVLFICNKKINSLSLLMLFIFIAISAIMTIWYDTILISLYILFSDVKKISSNTEDAASSGSGRWQLWEKTIEYIKEKPLFGHGLDGIAERLDKEAGSERTHNEFLQYTVFFGIPAGIMYVCGIMSTYLKALKYKHRLDIYSISSLTAAFGYLVSSFFGISKFYTAPFLFIFLGFGFVGNKEKINTKEDLI